MRPATASEPFLFICFCILLSETGVQTYRKTHDDYFVCFCGCFIAHWLVLTCRVKLFLTLVCYELEL